MKIDKQLLTSNWVYALLLIPTTSAILALNHWGFFFKSGSAGAGIILLLLLYWGQFKQHKDVWMLFVAFLFSIGGDWFLSHRNGVEMRFIYGIVLFFIAHVGYLSYGLMNGRLNRIFTLVLLSGFWAFFFIVIAPAISNPMLMAATLLYLLISCFSLGAAVGVKAEPLVKWVYFIGIFLVLFSDTIIALREFAHIKGFGWLILPTYYLAHIVVTFAAMRKIQMNIGK